MSKPYATDTAVVTSGGPAMMSGAADPSAGAGVPAAISTLYTQTGTAQIWRKTGAGDTAWVRIVFGSASGQGYYADGSDGAFAAPVGTTTLARDMFWTTVSVPNGAVIDTVGFRIFATRSITVAVGGIIRRNGNNAVGTAGGVAGAAGTLAPTNGGGAGNGGAGAGAAGSAATDVASQFTGIGGAGGTGSGGAGGAAGTLTAIAAVDGNFHQVVNIVNGIAIARSGSYMNGEAGSGGGGGGGGAAGQAGGGGGAGGGVMCLAAPYISNSGAIQARGGNGANAIGTNAGGGGGGGGGIIYIVCSAFVGTAPDVSGGNPGTGNGTGLSGTAGTAGQVNRVSNYSAADSQIFIFGDSIAAGQGVVNTLDNGVGAATPYMQATVDTQLGTGAASTVPRRPLQPYAGSGAAMGIELSMGRSLVEFHAWSGVLAIGKMAINGTTAAQWIPGSGFPVSPPYLIDRYFAYIDLQAAPPGKPMSGCICSLGANDAATDIDTANFYDNITLIYNALRARYPHEWTFYLWLLNAATSSGAITPARVALIRAAEVQFAIDNPEVVLVDTNFIPLADGVHPTAGGNWSAGNVFAQKIAATQRPGTNTNQGLGPAPWIQSLMEATVNSDAGTITVEPNNPTAEAGDWQVFVGGTSGNIVVPSLLTDAGFARISGSPTSSIAGGATQYADIWIRRVTQAMLDQYDGHPPNPVMAATNQRRIGWIFSVRGANATTPIHASLATVDNNNNTIVSINGVTTTVDNCLIAFVQTTLSFSDNPAINWTNAALPNLAVVRDSYNPTQETITLAVAELPAQGSAGTTVGTRGANSIKASWCLAFQP